MRKTVGLHQPLVHPGVPWGHWSCWQHLSKCSILWWRTLSLFSCFTLIHLRCKKLYDAVHHDIYSVLWQASKYVYYLQRYKTMDNIKSSITGYKSISLDSRRAKTAWNVRQFVKNLGWRDATILVCLLAIAMTVRPANRWSACVATAASSCSMWSAINGQKHRIGKNSNWRRVLLDVPKL